MESQNKAFSFDINNITKFNILNNLYYEAKFGMSFLKMTIKELQMIRIGRLLQRNLVLSQKVSKKFTTTTLVTIFYMIRLALMQI